MDDKLGRIRKEAVMVYPRYLGIYLLRKIMLNVIQPKFDPIPF
jgi:hypothetical protein